MTDAELKRFLEALKQEQLKAVGTARWLFFPRLRHASARGLGGGIGSEDPAAAEGAGSRPANTWLPLAALSVIALVVGLSWTGGFLIPGQIHLAGIFTVLSVGAITIYYLLFVTPMRLFKYHRVVGSPEDQRKVEWVWVSMLAALITIVVPLVVLAAVSVGSVFVPYLDAWMDAALLFVAIGTTLAPVLIMVAIGLSIQYRGAIDPKLALRGFTVWTVLGVVLTLVFVFIERSVALGLVSWLHLPPQSGYVAAGAIVAATFQPIRKRMEKWVNRFVERVMPETLLASGKRETCAVAVADISGHTALTAQDEQAALLASALLQKEAHRIAEAHQGRAVKSTGDGVILAFRDAGACLAAAEELHRAVAARAGALDLPALSLHSGLHWGEVVEMHDGDIYGMTVNLAARIADWAKAGEIGASGVFCGQLQHDAARFQAAGPQMFKNVPEPVDCHRLVRA